MNPTPNQEDAVFKVAGKDHLVFTKQEAINLIRDLVEIVSEGEGHADRLLEDGRWYRFEIKD